MGLDRLSATGLLMVVLLLAGCDSGGARPQRLLYGEPAAELEAVPGSVIAIGRVLDGAALGRRFTSCRPTDAGIGADTVVVERIGVFGESLTFTDSGRKTVYACDGGTDLLEERKPPWCGRSAGRLFGGKLLDPRLGVDQGSFTEVYEVLARLPVRIASIRGIQAERAQATFDVTQYDGRGKELIRGKLEAAVAG